MSLSVLASVAPAPGSSGTAALTKEKRVTYLDEPKATIAREAVNGRRQHNHPSVLPRFPDTVSAQRVSPGIRQADEWALHR